MSGMASFVAPQFSCHAVRIRLDRDTGVVRVLEVGAAHDSGTIINETGALGQIQGGVMMGIGQALTEGTVYDDRVSPAQRGAARVQAADVRRLARRSHTHFVQIATPDAGPRGAKGLAEAPNVATAAAISNALAKLRRQTGSPAADDRRACVGGDVGSDRIMNFTIATTLDEALAAVAAGARPVAGGSDLVVGARQGKSPLPDSRRRHRSHRVARPHRARRRRRARSARW